MSSKAQNKGKTRPGRTGGLERTWVLYDSRNVAEIKTPIVGLESRVQTV
jgi:hypothetical protein